MRQPEARRLFAVARVATLATVDASGGPHLVPITFVLSGDTVWSAVDAKPKRSARLRRLANIAREPRVSLLAQHWDEDWAGLWWVRADGLATVTATVEPAASLLRAKYPQYSRVAVTGPVIEVAVQAWRGWRAAGD